MLVPDFWAEARRVHQERGRQVTVRRYGWSNNSVADAQAMADTRADEALARVLSGERLNRRERRVAYNGAQGVPIREEVVQRVGDTVITRNSYGARCLNSPNVLFADIDLKSGESLVTSCAPGCLAVLLAIAVGSAYGSVWLGLIAWCATFAAVWLALRVGKVAVASLRSNPLDRAMQRVRTFVDQHREWNVRVYRTPAGLRLLATHALLSPTSDDVYAFFRAVKADPIYVQMCRNQQCFRARLTAKPWRIGIDDHIRPRRQAWPIDPEKLADRAAWVTNYEHRAAAFAACAFVEELGSGSVHPQVAGVVRLHDDLSNATHGALELA